MRAIAHPPIIVSGRRDATAGRITLRLRADGSFAGSIPPDLRGRWCGIALTVPDRSCVCTLRISGATPAALTTELILPATAWPSTGTRRRIVAFVTAEARRIRVDLFGIGPDGMPDRVAIMIRPLSRVAAGLTACVQQPAGASRALVRAVAAGVGGLPGRLRRELGALTAASGGTNDYTLWTRLFDIWSTTDLDRLQQAPTRATWPRIATLVFHAGGAPQALHATLAALDRAPLAVRPVLVGPDAPLANALEATAAEYVMLVQAGEIVPAHALPLLADQAVALGRPEILYADEDALTHSGRRHRPVFKPEPSRTLMLSGTLATGAWLVRRHLLSGATGGPEGWAEPVRLDAWLRLHEAGRAASSHRIPFILTHRRADTEWAPRAALAHVAAQHLARSGFPAVVRATTPLRLQVAAPRARQARVSIIVPSACRAPHVLRCLSRLLARTDYADFEVILVVAGRLPLDAHQRRINARLRSDPRVRPLILEADGFNYAWANNQAVRHATGRHVCLLNDDVAPLRPDWLAGMVGHLADPAVGIVGARLLYPDRAVQHAGIILRPDGTGEHAHRLLPRAAPGYADRAGLSQEVTAVTGACLLTRRDLYDRLGGLDESFASAFNDVDFCLRARAAGSAVVLAAEAELIHYESLSYGRHYGPEETARAAADCARMRQRWGAVCAADPFHNPNLGRSAGGLFLPAFPPRAELASFRAGASRAA